MDESFDGKVSYNELKSYIDSLGFKMSEFEIRINKELDKEQKVAKNEYMWRDKALETLIKVMKARTGKEMSFIDYFSQYDSDHDAHLTPA